MMRQEYDTPYLQGLIAQYSDIGTILDHHLFTSGFENSNYFVRTETGPYVIKIYEGMGMSPENIRFETEVMDRSFGAGVKTPRILRTKTDSLLTDNHGKLSILMDFIDGENMHAKAISDALIGELAAETGKMDTALSVFTDGSKTRQKYEFDLKNFMLLKDRVAVLPSTFDHYLLDDVFNRFASIEKEFLSMPSGIIHNDAVAHNMLVKDGHLAAIIDFSDMAYSPYVQNIAVSFAQTMFTYNWQPHQAAIFLKRYKEFHPLSDREKALLYDLTLARHATLILELNYWDVRYGKDEQRSIYVRDNYDFMRKLIEMGAEEFNTQLNA